MLVYPAERQPIAYLLQFLEHGERLAHDCAAEQARMIGNAKAARFLEGQARQEAMHAKLFQGAIRWLAPRQREPCPVLVPLERYRILLEEAIRRGDVIESLLAEQVILEGLGEAILSRIEFGLEKRGAPFRFLRRLLLHQEQAHHNFGRRMVECAVLAGETSYPVLRAQAVPYLALTHQMLEPLMEQFQSIDEDPALYLSAANQSLPPWLTEEVQV
jgi:hypothetical protein